jgi:glycosyltransferase involved in cell wall biosynthesis
VVGSPSRSITATAVNPAIRKRIQVAQRTRAPPRSVLRSPLERLSADPLTVSLLHRWPSDVNRVSGNVTSPADLRSGPTATDLAHVGPRIVSAGTLGDLLSATTAETARVRGVATVPDRPARGCMKILANAADLLPNNGIWTQTLQVTEELARRGHRIDLLYLQDGTQRDEYAGFCSSMQKVRRLDLELALRPLLHDGPRVAPAVWAGFRSHPDVIYVNRYRPLPWALATRALSRAPVVCHVHGYVGIEDPRVNRALSRFTARFLCVSGYVRDRFVELGADPRRTDVVYNGVDPADYPVGGVAERAAARRQLGLPEDAFIVMFFGQVLLGKGIGTLVEALEPFAGDRRSRRVELLVVGPQEDELVTGPLFNGAGIPVHQLPMRSDVVTPLHAADLVVVPSQGEEPFGRTVIEALATGRPVIASSVGGIPEILTGDFARFLVPPADPPALAAKIRETLGWREEEPALADDCAAHVARHFSRRGMVDAIEERLVQSVG